MLRIFLTALPWAPMLVIYLFGGWLAELLAEKSHHVEDLPDDPALGQRVGYLAVHALQAPQGPRHPHQPRVVLKIKYKIVYYLFFKNSHVLRPMIINNKNLNLRDNVTMVSLSGFYKDVACQA